MGVVIGVDGGGSKTDVVVATDAGELIAYLRGGGSNAHGPGGAAGSIAVVSEIVERARLDAPADVAALYLCGADMPEDIAALERAVEGQPWARRALVDNDTFALLRGGTDAADAVAVVCGNGINCVGRSARGDVARYPSLGWETGDWGGSEPLGREVVFHAARAEDGRGDPTALVDVVRSHFRAATVVEVGVDLHYRRLPAQRVGELAPAVLAAAEAGDAVARRLVDRLVEEIVVLAVRALRDLELESADIVLGGGMLRSGGLLHVEVTARLRERAPKARPVVCTDAPVLGAALAALDAAGAPSEARERLRAALAGMEPDG